MNWSQLFATTSPSEVVCCCLLGLEECSSVEVITHCWYLSVWWRLLFWRGCGPCQDMRLSSVILSHNISLFSCCSCSCDTTSLWEMRAGCFNTRECEQVSRGRTWEAGVVIHVTVTKLHMVTGDTCDGTHDWHESLKMVSSLWRKELCEPVPSR